MKRMHRTGRLLKALSLSLLSILAWCDATRAIAQASRPEVKNVDFGIFWPPRAPSEPLATNARPILNGRLVVSQVYAADRSLVIHLRVELSRCSDEAGRLFWNKSLAFPEYDWMRYVRVWDADQKWLWPNLAYLLRLHGVERVERYGGTDPGKGVDNDFAAVLIRKYDADGKTETVATKRQPLVAAEWYPVGSTQAKKETVVHAVQSDEFTLSQAETASGSAIVWLIYADFMGVSVPANWPKKLEYAGGILACFQLQWHPDMPRGQTLSVRQVAPPHSTGFDWEQWANRTRSVQDSHSTATLSEVNPTQVTPQKATQPGRRDE